MILNKSRKKGGRAKNNTQIDARKMEFIVFHFATFPELFLFPNSRNVLILITKAHPLSLRKGLENTVLQLQK